MKTIKTIILLLTITTSAYGISAETDAKDLKITYFVDTWDIQSNGKVNIKSDEGLRIEKNVNYSYYYKKSNETYLGVSTKNSKKIYTELKGNGMNHIRMLALNNQNKLISFTDCNLGTPCHYYTPELCNSISKKLKDIDRELVNKCFSVVNTYNDCFTTLDNAGYNPKELDEEIQKAGTNASPKLSTITHKGATDDVESKNAKGNFSSLIGSISIYDQKCKELRDSGLYEGEVAVTSSLKSKSDAFGPNAK